MFLQKIVKAEPGDFFNFTQRGGKFEIGRIRQAGLHRGEDGRLGVEAGADDKRKAEAREIRGVEPLKFGELGLGQTIEAGAGLFTGGLGGERVLPGETTGEIGRLEAVLPRLLPGMAVISTACRIGGQA
jgi:hypothetical protein